MENFATDFSASCLRERPIFINVLFECARFDKLHHNLDLFEIGGYIETLIFDNVWVIEFLEHGYFRLQVGNLFDRMLLGFGREFDYFHSENSIRDRIYALEY